MIVAGIVICGIDLAVLIGYGAATNSDFWSF